MPLVKIYMQLSGVRNFFPTFFRSNRFIFRIFLKDRFKKAFLGTFWKIFTKKNPFLFSAPSLKVVHNGAKNAFRKNFEVAKMDVVKLHQRGDPL